ncbi:MAG: phage tail protein [Pseudomonadota bacterium]
MKPEITIDARDFFNMSKEFRRLPREIKGKVMNRAYGRVMSMAKTRVVRLSAKRISIAQKHVRERVHNKANVSAAQRGLVVRSDWISLYALGARQGRRGVLVKGRKSIRGTFIANMSSGNTGVFRRAGADRLPINKMFGPNPANDVATSPDPFEDIMADVAESHLAPRMLHELLRILPD